jgi:broad specificity phosphatase PhoE
LKEITLLRHFRVKDDCPKKYFSSTEIDRWVQRYDTFALDYHDIALPLVDKVYTSALSRAKRSAKYLDLDYEESALFNEVSAKAFVDTSLKLPKSLWLFLGRVYWTMGWVKRSESKAETYARASEAVEILLALKEERILVLSHGFFMIVLAKELQRRGFRGALDRYPKNGKLYTFSEK